MRDRTKLAFVCLSGICAFIMISCTVVYDNKTEGLTGVIAFSGDDNNTVHIYTIKPDGTNVQPTSSDDKTRDWYPAWSADGKHIAFSSNESDDYEIWKMDADGSNRKRITSRQGLDTLPRWSPDGNKIVFAGTFRDAVNGQFSYDICVINAEGDNFIRLTHGSHSFNGDTQNGPELGAHCSCGESSLAWNNTPAWSPGGKKIVFASNNADDSKLPFLYVMESDGSDIRKLGFLSGIVGSQPDWSPATNKIVFTRMNVDIGEIWTIDAGSPFPEWTAKKLTGSNYSNHSPVWSPDGKLIAFISDQNGADYIFIMNSNGSDMRRLTGNTNAESHPSWR